MVDPTVQSSALNDGIKHVVLLMLENHSFDQMLGALQEIYPEVDGVTPELAAARHNLALDGTIIPQQQTTESQMAYDPKHEHVNVLAQLQGGNAGFVQEFQKAYPNSKIDDWSDVMGYYPLDFLPALHRLGREFTICDNWFSSLPGPTWPNRFFALSGTSMGQVLMPAGKELLEPHWYTEQTQDTIFSRMSEKNIPWRIYHYDFPASLILTKQREAENLARYAGIEQFFKDAAGKAESFPAFTFIEPQYFGVAQNDVVEEIDVRVHVSDRVHGDEARVLEEPGVDAAAAARMVRLQGVESVMAPRARRERAWARLGTELDFDKLDAMTREIGLGEAISAAGELLAGRVRGRIVVDVTR